MLIIIIIYAYYKLSLLCRTNNLAGKVTWNSGMGPVPSASIVYTPSLDILFFWKISSQFLGITVK